MTTNDRKTDRSTKANSSGTRGSSPVLSVIDATGKVSRSRDPSLSKEELLKLYATIVRTRVMEERAQIGRAHV